VKRLVIAAVSVLVLSLALPAAGYAGLPKPKNVLIKVPSKLGGVKLGMKMKDADKAWGKTGTCNFKPPFALCNYQGKASAAGSASIEGANKKAKVSAASIHAGFKDGKYKFKGALTRFETKEGLGLGDKISKLKKKYPKAKKFKGGGGYYVPGKGKSQMNFLYADGKHITTISLIDGTQG
jgi:hypothetical protein